MQKYIDQLLLDITAAMRAEVPIEDANLEEHFEEVERYIEEEPNVTLSQHCGMITGQFPEAGKLTETQQKLVIEALVALYGSYGVCLEIPENLPIAVQYPFYVAALETSCFVSNWGMTHIEYCGYNAEFCPFGDQHCVCRKLNSRRSAMHYATSMGKNTWLFH